MHHGVLCVMKAWEAVERRKKMDSDNRRRRLEQDFKTKFMVKMQFTDIEATYITQPTETLGRNNALHKIFMRRNDISIIDAFACVGGDSVSFMSAFPLCELHSVQQVTTAEETGRYRRLCDNVANAQRQERYRGVRFHPYDCSTMTFFSMAENVGKKIDLLFLDPPWKIGETVMDLTSMTEFLKINVFQPMILSNLMPEIICMKLSFSVRDLRSCQDFMQLIGVYLPIKSVPVLRMIRGTEKTICTFHIFKQNRPPTPPTSLVKMTIPPMARGLDKAFSDIVGKFCSNLCI